MRMARRLAFGLAGVMLGIQLVPYGRDHTNPPVTRDAPWASPLVRRIAVVACYDCHSNETKWPWYSNVAPMSWLVQKDVDGGRERLNFSEWDRSQDDDLVESVTDGSMPPRSYLLVHSSADLSGAERLLLLAALRAFERDDDRSGRRRGG